MSPIIRHAGPTLVFTGHSLVLGRSTPDCMTPLTGSGTTSPPWYAVHRVAGPRGALVTQMPWMANNIHLYNFGVSGNIIPRMIESYPRDVGLLADGTRSGPIVNICFEDGNTIGELGITNVQDLLDLKLAYKALHDADGIKLVWCAGISRKDMYTVAAISGGAISAGGLVQIASNNIIRADPLTYGADFIDLVADPRFELVDTPAHLANKPCFNTTFFQGGIDRVHLTAAGSEGIGDIQADKIAANDELLYPVVVEAGLTGVTSSGPLLSATFGNSPMSNKLTPGSTNIVTLKGLKRKIDNVWEYLDDATVELTALLDPAGAVVAGSANIPMPYLSGVGRKIKYQGAVPHTVPIQDGVEYTRRFTATDADGNVRRFDEQIVAEAD